MSGALVIHSNNLDDEHHSEEVELKSESESSEEPTSPDPKIMAHPTDEDMDRTLDEYMEQESTTYQSSIQFPAITARNFEVRPIMLQMLQMIGTFTGNQNEDPIEHLTKFVQMCENFKQQGVSSDALRLRLFPMSLDKKATAWLTALPPNSISTWDTLASLFKARFIPRGKRAVQRAELLGFAQEPGELFHEAWERFKEMWRNCPNHEQKTYVLLEAFWAGLDGPTVSVVENACNGGIGKKKVSELLKLYDEIAFSTLQQSDKARSGYRTYKEPNTSNASNVSKDIATQLAAMAKRFDQLEMKIEKTSSKGIHAIQASRLSCETCGEAHSYEDCPHTMETVHYLNNNQRYPRGNPYSNTYNQGMRDHPNFSWKNGPSENPPNHYASKPMAPPGFEQQQKSRESDSETNQLLRQILKSQEGIINKVNLHDTSIRNLEIQVGQIASQINTFNRNSLPSDTVPNPRRDGKEDCKAITLRSGKQLADIPSQSGKKKSASNEVTTRQEDEIQTDIDEVAREQSVALEKIDENKEKTCTSPLKYVPQPPFPQRLKKHQEDSQFKKFIQIFKQLHINIPFAEALEHMPKYAKFMKDILSKKRRFSEFETVAVTKSFTDIIKQMPPKLKDPGSFSVPCHIGDKFLGKGMCDLGASINLMPLSVFNQLGLGEARPTTVTLQFADRSLSQPRGIIEDVLVKVDKFIFPADFIVLDFEADKELPLLLGRPFLATARTLIDVEKGELTMRVADEQVTFNMTPLIKSHNIPEDCFFIDMLDPVVQNECEKVMTNEPLEAVIPEIDSEKFIIEECKAIMDASIPCPQGRMQFESSKKWYDKKIIFKTFDPGQQVLLNNSRLRLFPGKLKSRWSGPFIVVQVFDPGTVELEGKSGEKFKVNGQRLKHYWGGGVDCQTTTLPLTVDS